MSFGQQIVCARCENRFGLSECRKVRWRTDPFFLRALAFFPVNKIDGYRRISPQFRSS